MRKEAATWTLEDLIDFEQDIAASSQSSAAQAAVISATRGLDGTEARRVGLKTWLLTVRNSSPGQRFTTGLGLVGFGVSVFMFISGASGVLGLMDREKGGINVSLFLAILLGVQWLILISAFIGWTFRRKAAQGFSSFQSILGQLALKVSGNGATRWWQGLIDGGTQPRAALLWRLARHAQAAGMSFNLGIVAGLAGLVMVRHVGFFWETTTEDAMRATLGKTVNFLSFPWSAWWPSAVPDTATIQNSRWLPGNLGRLAPGPAAWWEFLLATVVCWGLLPRALLWLLAWKSEKAALAKMDFQGRHHRTLWRELTGTVRLETESTAPDGVLVLDVGGSGLHPETLRPFLLRHLRVNPVAWKNVAVLSENAEQEAMAALAKAPEGVVLLAEGWSLSPPRMTDLHSRVRAMAGKVTPIKFLAANVSGDGSPTGVTAEERKEWERFVDSLRDPLAEIHFYTTDQTGL